MPADAVPVDAAPVEIRCPVHSIRILLKIGKPMIVDGANVIEVACRDCRKDLRRQGRQVTDVIHVYNVVGEILTTRVT